MATKNNAKTKKFDPSFIAGCLAGSANIVTGYPFDTVKVRLQASQCSYAGPWSCFKSIIKEEGIRGLYRGLSAPLIGGALETGINYAVFEKTLQHLRNIPDPIAVPASAATAAIFLSFVISPVELVKCRMQLGSADPLHRYTSPLDCMKQVIQREGFWGLTRGLGATLCREIPGNIVYFSSYKMLRELISGKPKEIHDHHDFAVNTAASGKVAASEASLLQALLDASSTIACGAASGMLMWVVVQPIDVVKTRIQTALPGSRHDYGIVEHLNVLHRGGRRRLYAGLSPTLIRAAPANAAQWMVYELCVAYSDLSRS